MKKVNNLIPIKRIAIVAPLDKRKEVIEWSYFNKHRLARHKLIATYSNARILKGTVNTHVHTLDIEEAGGYEQLSALITEKKVDIVVFFDHPLKKMPPNDGMRKLLDLSLEMNLVIASYKSEVDFMPLCA